MFYATLFGHLPFWGETEDEFIDKILNAPFKFDEDVPLTPECKDLIKGMLQKDPAMRSPLVDIMNLEYFMMDDQELEENIQKALVNMEEMKQKEEEKAEKQWESDILSGLHLSH